MNVQVNERTGGRMKESKNDGKNDRLLGECVIICPEMSGSCTSDCWGQQIAK